MKMKTTRNVFERDKLLQDALEKSILGTFDQFYKAEICECDYERDCLENEFVNEFIKLHLYYSKYDYIEMYVPVEHYAPYKFVEKIFHCLTNGKFTEYKASAAEIVICDLLERYQCKKMYIEDSTLFVCDYEAFTLEYIKDVTIINNTNKIAIRYKDNLIYTIDLDSEEITSENEITDEACLQKQ
jgi:hypothetical protein